MHAIGWRCPAWQGPPLNEAVSPSLPTHLQPSLLPHTSRPQNSTEQLARLEKAFDEVKQRLLGQVGRCTPPVPGGAVCALSAAHPAVPNLLPFSMSRAAHTQRAAGLATA